MKFDKIRPFYDSEVNDALQSIADEKMMQAILKFTFPDQQPAEWKELLSQINSTDEFQKKIIYKSLQRVLAMSSDGLTTSGFDKLDKNTPYLYISNHRDIILDTSLLNFTLVNYGLLLTASAIGDNLVKLPFMHTMARINRNFLVLRNLPPRELLEASVVLSEYIYDTLHNAQRSVWIAQREGRTKDGNDATHAGVLKMISLAAEKGENLADFFKKLRIVPISISYKYDPTDVLKLPELLAQLQNQTYVKSENEDFNSLYSGIIGQKSKIHIHAGNVIDNELDEVAAQNNSNKQVKMLTQIIDNEIIRNYKLWQSNYIAHDLLYHSEDYAGLYSQAEKITFEGRMAARLDINDAVSRRQFLAMYANPVTNKANIR